MLRPIAIGLLAAAVTLGCVDEHPATSGGYYCERATGEPCAQHEGDPDCQPCPRSSMNPTQPT